ncbi:hypothetical protein ILYODFUR_023095 [Ilyodon furcidens]|uniref:Uncharacterized protein n=1 Tax=Ilyodon furcidens TaxID=33524 RepID=A0ABV0VGD2_9TELE
MRQPISSQKPGQSQRSLYERGLSATSSFSSCFTLHRKPSPLTEISRENQRAIQFLYSNGNSIRKWRGGGERDLSLRFLRFFQGAGGDIRRASAPGGPAGCKDDREV